MEWISVKDRLPNDNAYIMVWVTTISMCDVARFIKPEMIYESTTSDWDCEEVTHWMPLPQPPKK